MRASCKEALISYKGRLGTAMQQAEDLVVGIPECGGLVITNLQCFGQNLVGKTWDFEM